MKRFKHTTIAPFANKQQKTAILMTKMDSIILFETKTQLKRGHCMFSSHNIEHSIELENL